MQRGRQLTEKMKEVDPVERMEITTTRDIVLIGNEEYIPKVTPPEATKVLQYLLPELNQIMAVTLDMYPERIYLKDNKFTSYTMATNNIEEINKAYMKLRHNHAEAKHIACAWNVPSSIQIDACGNCDDGDYGVSHDILRLLLKENIQCRAVFVVRNCGQKLNQDRNKCYLQSAINVLRKFQYNKVTKTNQPLMTKEVEEILGTKSASSTYSSAVTKKPVQQPIRGNSRSFNPRGRGKGSWKKSAAPSEQGAANSGEMEIEVYSPPSEEQLKHPEMFRFATPWEAHLAETKEDTADVD